MSLTSGTFLGPYQILSPLGKGGMGEVYRARDTRLNRDVAIKVLPEEMAKHREALKRFEREARALAALSHPNILAVFDVGTDQGISFVVTELLHGETLRDGITRTSLSWDKAVEIAIPVAEALSEAHSKGIIHRDLKPENIFFTSGGVIKILDFGLARWKENVPVQELTEAPTASLTQTEAGHLMGTIPYMSPEQLRGATVDQRTDIFSFGCVLYEMISGRRPFSGATPAETAALILKEDPPPLSESRKEIPVELDRLIHRCMEKNVDRRFQSARDLALQLKDISGDSRVTKPRSAIISLKQRRFGRAVGLVVALLLLLGGISLYQYTRPGSAIRSLAVIPFVNLSRDTNMEYLSDGISESLMNSLAQLPNLRVLPRSSSFRYKGKEIDTQSIGRQLKVEAVLSGRVQQRGNNLFVSAELVDVRNNRHLWGEQYNRNSSDILALQEEISAEISDRLRLKLTGEDQKRLTKRHTENTEAYHLYLKGRKYWNLRTTEGYTKGIAYFEQAIQKDPNYALAYSGLSDCYRGLESPPRAKEMAIKALQLDDNLAEAHASLGRIRTNHEWDWPGAEAEFKRAIRLNPNYVEGHHAYSHYLIAMGRADESLAESKQALELDPVDIPMNTHLAWHYLYTKQYDLAIEQCKKTLEMEPNFYLVRVYLGMSYRFRGMYPQAIAELQRAVPLSEASPEARAELAQTYAISGNKTEAVKILEEYQDPSKPGHLTSYDIAMIHLSLGEKDLAFQYLEQSFKLRRAQLVYLKVDPALDPLRSDLRFQDLLRRMHL